MTSRSDNKRFPGLDRPPIVEVVCGIVFEPIRGLDPLSLGIYWDSRSDDFPNKALQPAFVDEAGIAFGAFPMRVQLRSADRQFLLQLQHDRFYMNWTASGRDYPRFSERHGPRGLRIRALEEYELFASFIEKRFGSRPRARRIELTKVDLLKRGEHWRDLADLADLVPVTGTLSDIHGSNERELNLQFVEHADDGTAIVHVATVRDGGTTSALRIECRRAVAPVSDLGEALDRANAIVNHSFFKLIPSATEVFGRTEDPR